MLLNVSSAVTVECYVLYSFAWVCLICLLLCKEEGSYPVFLQLLRGIWTCMRGACLCFFWDVDYTSQLTYVWHYVVVKSSAKRAREECESKRAYALGA